MEANLEGIAVGETRDVQVGRARVFKRSAQCAFTDENLLSSDLLLLLFWSRLFNAFQKQATTWEVKQFARDKAQVYIDLVKHESGNGTACLFSLFLIVSHCFSLFLIVSHCFSLFQVTLGQRAGGLGGPHPLAIMQGK